MTFVDPTTRQERPATLEEIAAAAAIESRVNARIAQMSNQISTTRDDTIQSLNNQVDGCFRLIGETQNLIENPPPTVWHKIGDFFVRVLRCIGLIR